MTVSRGTLGRIQAQIARLRASLPPLCIVVEDHEGEPGEALETRIAEARARAGARPCHVVIVDRDEEGAA